MPTTAELHAAYLHQAHKTFNPREIRLSEVGQCPRRQTLRILGYPADPPTDKQLAIFDTCRLHIVPTSQFTKFRPPQRYILTSVAQSRHHPARATTVGAEACGTMR